MSTVRKFRDPVSIAYKAIRLKTQDEKIAAEIAKAHRLSPVAARVLAARGFSPDKNLKNFIQPSLREGLPHPIELKNLASACELISQIVKEKRPIAICCDFDVDGLSGGAQVHHFFNTLGIENQVFVPDRFEDGYGLNDRMIKKIAKADFGLIITIDYGTTNIKELSLAKEFGLKTIVVDHHHVGDSKPPADVFVNPNQKGCGFADQVLCASGLAWYLIMHLKNYLKGGDKIDPKSYLDLACLGTICDMVPLVGTNRIIAKRGLEQLTISKRVGLNALKNVAGLHGMLSCSDVSFGIGPRLNAAGRMVHGEVVIELLTTSDSEKAKKLSQQLNKLNTERQETENQVKDRAIEIVSKRGFIPAGLVIHNPDFHTGVVGIVAQRLVETFYRPAVVLGMDSPGIFKGSVRGIKGFSVVESLAAVSKHLIKYGGHSGAGGLSLEENRLADFALAYEKECEKRLSGLELDPYVEADTEVALEDINVELVEELSRFAPFGMGNPNPVLLVRDLRVTDLKVLKDAHLKATLSDGKRYISGLFWRQTSHPDLIPGKKVNLAFRPDTNNFRGTVELQANIQAVEKA